MIVRKLAPAEYYRAHLVQAVAFEGNSEYQKEKEEAEKQPPAADKDNWMSVSYTHLKMPVPL